MSSPEVEITNLRVFRKLVNKIFKIKNISVLAPSEKITFDVAVDNNVYILGIGITSNEFTPFIYVSVEQHNDNVKRNVKVQIVMKDIDNRPFFQVTDHILQNSPFTALTKYTVRDITKGYLIIHYQLSYLSWEIEETSRVKKTISFDRIENLSRDFGRLYSERTNADVVIQVGKASIPVHSQILSARSEVFAAMFKHDMTEKLNKTIQISDIGAMIIHYLLEFIYTGKLEKMADFCPDTLKQLYSAADKYAVMELKEMISDSMLSNISQNNVASCAFLAFRHCDQRMQEAVIQFVSQNLAILDSKEWKELEGTEPSVADEIWNIICTKGQAKR